MPKAGLDRFRHSADYLLEAIHDTVGRVSDEELFALADRIQRARVVFLFGRGRSGLVARALAIRLSHLGVRAYVVGETITPPVGNGDLVLLFSGSGETFSVTLTGEIAQREGAHVAAITAEPDSSLARISETTVIVPTTRDAEQARLAPLGTLFEQAALVVADALVAHLMEELGESEATMRRRHATLE